MKKRRIFSFILLLAVLLCSCGSQVEQEPDHQPVENILLNEPEDTQGTFSAEVVDSTHIEEPLPPHVYKYFIRVNLFTNTVTVYAKDNGGEYTVPYLSMICSTGEDTPTEGTYYLPGRHWPWLSLQGDVYGQYVTQIIGNILFHSVPYETLFDKSSLETLEYNKLGTSASMGCVRLQAGDAKWIYDNAMDIEAVEFYSEPDPGPLGWPASPYIPPFDERSGWDPTDPDPENPWNLSEE